MSNPYHSYQKATTKINSYLIVDYHGRMKARIVYVYPKHYQWGRVKCYIEHFGFWGPKMAIGIVGGYHTDKTGGALSKAVDKIYAQLNQNPHDSDVDLLELLRDLKGRHIWNVIMETGRYIVYFGV